MKRNKLLIIIIAAVVAVGILVVAFTLIFGKRDSFVNITTQTKDSVVIDFGEWKGKYMSGTPYCKAEIEDIDGFVSSLKRCDCYDEKLFFEKKDGVRPYDTYYFVKNNRIFLLWTYDNIVELQPLEQKYYYVDCFSDESPIMYAMVDVWSTNFDSSAKKHGITTWRDSGMTYDDVKYLYQKLDKSMYKIEDDKIYLKCMSPEFDDELSLSGYKFHDVYSVVIYELNGELVVEPIYEK